MRRRIEPLPGGGYRVQLSEPERELLRRLSRQLRDLVADRDPAVTRLFPPAYASDPDAEREYRRLVGDALLDGKLAALAALEATAGAERLDDEELESWLAALESMRLALGTQLDVGEDAGALPVAEDHPDAPHYALYGWLSWLQEEVVAALASRLPPG